MRLLLNFFATMVLCMCLAGCSEKDMIQRFLPKEDDAMGRKFIEAVRSADYDGSMKMMDPDMRMPKTLEGIKNVHTFLDHGQPISVETIGFRFMNLVTVGGGATRNASVTYQIHFPGHWMMATVLLVRRSGTDYVSGLNVQPVADDLAVLNRFSLSGDTPLISIFFLLMAVAIPLFCLYVLVVCIRSPIRRKWLWAIIVLLGGGVFRVNWNTGHWDYQPFTVLLLGASVLRSSIYEPWVIGIAVPAGAILFLVFRRSLIAGAAARSAAAVPAPALPPPPLPPPPEGGSVPPSGLG